MLEQLKNMANIATACGYDVSVESYGQTLVPRVLPTSYHSYLDNCLFEPDCPHNHRRATSTNSKKGFYLFLENFV